MRSRILLFFVLCIGLCTCVSAQEKSGGVYVSTYLKDPYSFASSEAAKGTVLHFIVPEKNASFVMGKAQSLLSKWEDKRAIRKMMKIQTVTDGMIDTFEPKEIRQHGMNVSCIKVREGKEITVKGKSYEDDPFSISNEHRESTKRAELLSFLLQEYEKELESQEPEKAIVITKERKLKPEVEALLDRIKTDLLNGDTDFALVGIDKLKEMVKKKE